MFRRKSVPVLELVTTFLEARANSGYSSSYSGSISAELE